MKDQNFTASSNPIATIDKIAYEGQPPYLRMYRPGFELLFNQLPVLKADDQYLDAKIRITQDVMKSISESLGLAGWPFMNNSPQKFKRTIIGIEDTETGEGAEVVVARWSEGFSSPVHGHAPGYMHEEILKGKLRVDTFRIVDKDKRIVRPSERVIIKKGVFVSEFSQEATETENTRDHLVHTFTALEQTTTLHFLPEHTRDGRDNQFTVENFADAAPLTKEDVSRIDSRQGFYLPKGEVVLVRSTNVPDYGDHYIVIIGHPVVKEHGLRPQDRAFPTTSADTGLLDEFPLRMGLTLLRLNPEARDRFHEFHGIEMVDGNVVFPSI